MKTRTLLAAAVLFMTCAAAHAQTKWDMPTPYSDGEFHTINVKQFADDVKKATGGKLEIVVHSNGSLIKHPDMLRAVSTGQVNIVEFLLGQFAVLYSCGDTSHEKRRLEAVTPDDGGDAATTLLEECRE